MLTFTLSSITCLVTEVYPGMHTGYNQREIVKVERMNKYYALLTLKAPTGALYTEVMDVRRPALFWKRTY